jgi:chromosome partitioning protein
MITSFISMKGGTAKTTTSVNLAAYLALLGQKVLLIDLDPQNFTTVCLGVDTQKLKCTIANALLNGIDISNAIHPSNVSNLDILPADRSLASFDILLGNVAGRERILKEKLRKIQNRYDYILIDNPPSLNLLSLNALVASDNYVITVSPTFLSLVGLPSLLESIEVIKCNMELKLKLLGILPTIVDLRLKVSTEILDLLRTHFKEKVFNSSIRENVKLQEAPIHGKTIFEFDSGSTGALHYMYFGKEYLARCKD